MTSPTVASTAHAPGAADPLSGAHELRVDYQKQPLGITSERPRFSWVFLPTAQALTQQSFRLRVWLHPDDSTSTTWDSGDVTSADSVGITYDGPPLQPRTRYHWQVVVTDDVNQSWESPIAWFETAPAAFPETAQWISGLGAEPVLSKTFSVANDIRSARLFVCGLGLHRASLNGQPVNDHRLSPAVTHFDRRVLYVPADVTAQLTPGDCTLEIALGAGFYALPTQNVWNWHQPPWKDDLVAVAELHLEHSDGRREVIVTDDSWSVRTGGTTVNCLYAGETFDATLTGESSPATVTSGPSGQLLPQQHEPVRVTWSGTPEWRQIGDAWVADFGRTLAGWVSLRTSEPAGTKITMTYAEVPEADGTLHPVNRHVEGERFQVDEYVSDGTSDQQWEPQYTYKGFRHVQVDGLTTAPDDRTLTAHLAHNDVDQVGFFSCSEPLLETFDRAMARTILNNLHHFPTDTPVYEKNGWTGDAQLGAVTMMLQFGMHGVLRKWLDDLRDSQHPDGALPVISPTAGWGYNNLGPSPEWTTVYPFVLRELYRFYADVDLVREHWDAVVHYLDWELGKLVDGVCVSELGDYLQPGTPGNGPDDSGVTATSFLIRALRATAELGEVIDKPADTDRFRRGADELTAAMNARYLHASGTHYVVGEAYSQTSNAVPLVFGLVPAEHVDAVVRSLVEDVERRGNLHNVGCIGANTLLQALSAHGHADLALTVARQTEYPSWGFWFEHGADTLWEMWETTARSRNHYFHGTVAQWSIENVAGLTDADHGWATFSVRPEVIGDLTQAGHRIETVRGTAASAWSRDGRDFRLEVTVPSGSSATVTVPGIDVRGGAIDHDHQPAAPADGDGGSAVTVGTGRWEFTSVLSG